MPVQKTHPYWQYLAILDGNTRKSHAAMHGRVFRFDDPIWDTFYPPNDWGCRCRVRTLTAAQVKTYGADG
ncbi:phage minor head protein [Erwinia tracheiphila]